MKKREPQKQLPVREQKALDDDELERVRGGGGIFKLKQHVDNPGQTPM